MYVPHAARVEKVCIGGQIIDVLRQLDLFRGIAGPNFGDDSSIIV